MNRRQALAGLLSLSVTGCLRLTEERGGGTESSNSGGSGTTGSDGTTPADGRAVDIWVAPGGEGGDGSREAPFATLGPALNAAGAGDTVYLQSGEHRFNGQTRAAGDPGNPIEITGPPDAVVRAYDADAGAVLRINHSHVHVTGLTFDGLVDRDRQWESPEAWIRTVAEISPGPRFESDGVDYLEDVVFEPHAVRNSRIEFVNIERTRDASLGGFTVTGPAGAGFHPDMNDPVESHIGHMFDVGTSTPTIKDYRPYDGLDRSGNVRIHHVDNSAGYHHSKFVVGRVGTEQITVEYCTDRNAGNETSGQERVSAVAIGGNNCTVRGNDIGDCRQGVGLSAWTPDDMADASNWARNNDVYTNRFQRVSGDVFWFVDTSPDAQRAFCDNQLIGIDSSDYEYATSGCPDSVSAVDGIGHTVGE